MPALNIRGIPSDLHDLLREEARDSHRSLSAVVLAALVEHADRVRQRKRLQRLRIDIDRFRRSIGRRHGVTQDSVELLRADRAR